MIIDDELLLLQITKESLEFYGYKVITSTNGFDAINLFFQNPDIILAIIDSYMPVMTGEEQLKL